MPEMAEAPERGLKEVLHTKQGTYLSTYLCQEIRKALDSDQSICSKDMEDLLNICIKDPKVDLPFAVNTMKIVAAVIKKYRTFTIQTDLLPSMLQIIQVVKKLDKCECEGIPLAYFEIILSYPEEIFLKLEEGHNFEILELLSLYLEQSISVKLKVVCISLLNKYLKALPPDKRRNFVRESIDLWFLKLIPEVMVLTTLSDGQAKTSIEALELVVNELVHVDYFNKPSWETVLECLSAPEKFPTIMTKLLLTESDIWHRLWIVYIKLLKDHITKNSNMGRTPINSMLTVVETAFKMDIENKCRAFECWNVLIDNFSTEEKEVYINKRLKLLLIPLCANNAKVEEIVIVKLETWWHLICCFHAKVKEFSNKILQPFIEFCFGKYDVCNESFPVPGLMSKKTKEQCMYAFVNIIGHHNCDGCVALPKLNGKVVTTNHLLDNWKNWIHYMNLAIQIAANNTSNLRRPLKCSWISFVRIICDLPDDINKGMLFRELLLGLENFNQGSNVESLSDIILNDLILSLFNEDDNEEINEILMYNDEQSSTVHKILTIILNPVFDSVYNRIGMTEAVIKLKPVANFILNHYFNTIEVFLKEYNSLVLWTAFTASICEMKQDSNLKMVYEMLLWPLQHMDLFSNVEYSMSLWLVMYDLVYMKVSILPIKEEIMKVFKSYKNINLTNSSYLLNVSVMLLKQKLNSDNVLELEQEVDLVLYVIGEIHTLNHFFPEILNLLGIISQIITNLSHSTNVNIATKVLSIIKFVFPLLFPELKQSTQSDEKLILVLDELLKSLKKIFQVDEYASLKQIVSTVLSDTTQYLEQQPSLKTTIDTTLRMLISDNDNPTNNNDNNEKDALEQDPHKKKLSDEDEFTTPGKTNEKKNEARIEKTVVENGEEFVVVKSKWKFNPKKLTDNQKEKLIRKREDIPALYQDLSQSQDDFKLNAWKSDSQDATTSSKSNDVTSNGEVSLILKDMPKTDFVPNILKDILTGNYDKVNTSPELSEENINETESPINREVKTPRLPLKDRVFRNVRNLIEKSNIHNDGKEVKSLINDVTKTPVTTQITTTKALMNSAPSKINLERPSRLKRKPKKFEDLQMYIKKRRHSVGNSDSQNSDSDSNQIQDSTNSEQQQQEKTANPSGVLSENLDNQCKETPHCSKDTITVGFTNDINKKDISNSDIISETLSDPEIVTKNNNSHSVDENIKPETALDNLKHKNNEPSDTKYNNSVQSPSNKKTNKKRSRIEQQLKIDMVEGHPLLQAQTPKRLTRKNVLQSPSISNRNSLTTKLNKIKMDKKNTPKASKQLRRINEPVNKKTDEKNLDTFPVSQDSNNSQDINGSQDVIESSQDSTVSVMSAKPIKHIKRIPIVALENIQTKILYNKTNQGISSLNIPSDNTVDDSVISDCEKKDISRLPDNKPAADQIDLTANMDTESIGNITSEEIVVINDGEDSPIVIDTDETFVEIDTQDIADADTQPVDPNTVINTSVIINSPENETHCSTNLTPENQEHTREANCENNDIEIPTQDQSTKSLTESLLSTAETAGESSSTLSFKEDEQRKQDFLNNTLEISPIKILSPVREDKSQSPETSSDYMVIKLSSPVQSNGEPCEKCDSPEIFTEDKVSPDKWDQSPPRERAHVTNASPKSLSLKRNKPQVRTGGRGAQMLGLCVPVTNRLQTIMNVEKCVETDEPKKSTPLNSTAKRNLRILYDSTSDSNETSEENEGSENFLRLKRTLPSSDSSPSIPILKRKLVDIVDETTTSPASKRKRVSFHDPPVSTTICVKKYIEPSGVYSPQSSIAKRQERQLRSQVYVNLKSQKRLDTVFKLDTALTKAVESFSEGEVTPTANEDTEIMATEATPLVEVVKNSELNDVDPICADLINCNDPINNIAADLSSSAMRPLLVKEFAGKIETIGDLAKMTELEVNRLCIKAPKVKIAKSVLTEYAKTLNDVANEIPAISESALNEVTVDSKVVDVEMQTECVETENIEVQTESLATSLEATQTDIVSTVHCTVQTDESRESTDDIVTSLMEKPDFCERLIEKLDTQSKQVIADSLPPQDVINSTVRKLSLTTVDASLIQKLMEHHTLNSLDDKSRQTFIRDYLSELFTSKDLILFCSDLLKKVHDKYNI